MQLPRLTLPIASLVFWTALSALPAQVGAPQLLRDIRPGVASSSPDNFVAFRDHTYFFATDPGLTTARGLFRTDGTTAGTTMVFGSLRSPNGLFRGPGFLVFHASDGLHGDELWVSDGTTAGTRQFDIHRPGAIESNGSRPRGFLTHGNRVFFLCDDGIHGRELWVVDGQNPPALAIDFDPGAPSGAPGPIAVIGCTMVLMAGIRLWATDGTAAGTIELVTDPNPVIGNVTNFPPAMQLLPSGHGLFKASYIDPVANTSGSVFWITDGTPGGTGPFTVGGQHVVFNNTASQATPVGVFWIADRQNLGTELWIIDGPGSLLLVADLNPGAGGSAPQFITFAGNELYFSADDGTGRALFRTDGTPTGTIKIGLSGATFGGGAGLDTKSVVFLANADPAGMELWHTDGTATGFTRLSNINANGNSVISTPLLLRGRVYFAATQGISGNEPWVLDPGRVAWEDRRGCGCPPPQLRFENGKIGATLHIHGGVVPGFSTGLVILAIGNGAPVPIQIPGTGCEITVQPMATLVFVPTLQNGQWTYPLQVPNNPNLVGLYLASQAAVVDSSSLSLTNQANVILGN